MLRIQLTPEWSYTFLKSFIPLKPFLLISNIS